MRRCDSGVQVTDTMFNCFLQLVQKIFKQIRGEKKKKKNSKQRRHDAHQIFTPPLLRAFLSSFFLGDIVGRLAFFHKFKGRLLRRRSGGGEEKEEVRWVSEGVKIKGPAHIWTTPSAHAENLAAAFTVQISGEFYSLLW